jgi:Ser/Thr protein kinase RdoA (MazF antagonist)
MGCSHGDIAPDNVIFDANTEKVKVIIDLDETEYGFPIRDVTKALYYFCFDEKTNQLDTKKTQSFFSGYLSEYKMTMNEARSVTKLLALFAKELPERYIKKSKDPDFFENCQNHFLKQIPERSNNIIETIMATSLSELIGAENMLKIQSNISPSLARKQ